MHDTDSAPPQPGRTHNLSGTGVCRQSVTSSDKPSRLRIERLQLRAFIRYFSLCLIFMLASNIGRANESMTNEASTNDGTGVLILTNQNGADEALMLDTVMTLDVKGLLADMTLEQSFRNTTGQWREGRYLFPLPDSATVRGLTVMVGERVIKSQIMPRSEASETYTQARDAGKVATLVEQQRPNLFSMQLASIAPNDTIHVRLDVMLAVSARDNTLSLTLPTTLTPRYINAQTTEPQGISSPFARQDTIRGPRLQLNARIEPLSSQDLVTSPTHSLNHNQGAITLRNAPMDRDLILRWPSAGADTTSGLAFSAIHEGKRYMQLLVSPPVQSASVTPRGRELILIVDKSGSMAGVSINAAREALQGALDGLGDNDYFNIVAFDDNTFSLFDTSKPATAETIAQARRFTRRLQADGGTEMSDALKFALNAPSTTSSSDVPTHNRESENSANASAGTNGRLRQLVFLTDGSVGYEDALLTLIQQRIGNSRLFTVGIGSAPNSWFLHKAAETGRGTSLSIRDTGDVAEAVGRLLNRLEQPVLTDLTVQYIDGSGEIYPSPIPDVYAGEPLMLTAQISTTLSQLKLTGRQGEQRWTQTIAVPKTIADSSSGDTDGVQAINELVSSTAGESVVASATSADWQVPARPLATALAQHWTQRKIENLLDDQRGDIDNERHRDTITELALNASLITPYTSYVAVEAVAVRDPLQPLPLSEVANLVPAGNSMQLISLPQGAAGSDTLMLISIFSALLGLLLVGTALRIDTCTAPMFNIGRIIGRVA